MQLTDFGFLFSLRFAFYKLHISLHLRLKPRRPKSPRVLTVWLATFVTFLLPVCLLYFLISWPTFTSWQLQFQLVSSGAPSSFVAVVGAGILADGYAYDRLRQCTARKSAEIEHF